MARVLVCGGRNYGSTIEERAEMASVLHKIRPSVVIHGDADGADYLAGKWGALFGVPVEAYPAKWSLFGRRAGPLRNAQMLAEGKPDLVVAFPGGRGTADMVRKARAAGIEVIEVSAHADRG